MISVLTGNTCFHVSLLSHKSKVDEAVRTLRFAADSRRIYGRYSGVLTKFFRENYQWVPVIHDIMPYAKRLSRESEPTLNDVGNWAFNGATCARNIVFTAHVTPSHEALNHREQAIVAVHRFAEKFDDQIRPAVGEIPVSRGDAPIQADDDDDVPEVLQVIDSVGQDAVAAETPAEATEDRRSDPKTPPRHRPSTSPAAGCSSDAVPKAPHPLRHQSRIVRAKSPPPAESASFSAHLDPNRRRRSPSSHSRPPSSADRHRPADRSRRRSSSWESVEVKSRSRRSSPFARRHSPPSTTRRRSPPSTARRRLSPSPSGSRNRERSRDRERSRPTERQSSPRSDRHRGKHHTEKDSFPHRKRRD